MSITTRLRRFRFQTHCLSLVCGLMLVLAPACSFTKDLQAHHEQLLAATSADVPLREKRDVLANSTVSMMHEAVDKLNPKKGVRYVKAYAKTNGALLDTLSAQIIRGQQQMSTAQRVTFMLGAATQPYAKDAIDLIPRFIKKYQQVQAVSRITNNLKEAVLGKAADKLDDFLGQAPSKQNSFKP